jgi:DNA-directed RNA polymerase I subunit RPA1
MKRVEVSLFVARLKLAEAGLLKELHDLEDLKYRNTEDGVVNDVGDDDSEDDADVKQTSLKYERFVAAALSDARRSGIQVNTQTEAVVHARRTIIKDFMASINKGKKCGNCTGINHSYRKDRSVKIFKKALTEKEHTAVVQAGLKAKDPIIELRRQRRIEERRKRKRDEDEAVADLDRSSDEDVDMEESSEEEPEIAGGTLVGEAREASGKRAKTVATAQEEYLNPSRVLAQLTRLFERESEIMGLVYGSSRRRHIKGDVGVSADMFFMHAVLVPPNRFRPEARTGSNEIAEAQENTTYKTIITQCESITQIQRELSGLEKPSEYRLRARTYVDLETTWLALQEAVNGIVDKGLAPVGGRAAARIPDGVKQKLEKKEGMFRKYMMGKRVNFAARTVISPDPNIETNEIGVPPVFAIKLTYPEPVTQWNIDELQEAVRNGAFVWPGAVAIEDENGSVVNLERKSADERVALANQLLSPAATGNTRGTRPKKVLRHLNNGDIVIMNRQPTLHKPSMMCHRARVLPGEKTLRMHYANCNTYNADFDGDEMNMHFPQNELARAEALSIADTDHQYLSATAGKPLRGLIQDHISISVWLSNRDMFFDRGEYMNLLYAALRPEHGHCASGRVETLPPAVMKPKALWTGKQVFSTVLKNLTPRGAEGLTMIGKSTTDAKLWGKSGSEEGTVIFKDGELLSGILDKTQIGPTSGGLVDCVYQTYGHTIAGKLLSVLGRLLTKLLHMRAFSCGVEDLVFTKQGEEARQKALAPAATAGLDVAAKYVGLEEGKTTTEDRELRRRLEDVLRDDTKQQVLDQLTSGAVGKISSDVSGTCMPAALYKPFPKNQMQTMTNSGAKGSKVNVNLISCNLGQQTLEGRRVPVMVSGKTLPCFKPFETSVRAGGYIVDRFLTGIRPQEYFFHAMAGREGLIDTAVKTSRSGYLQRCLIKGMEGLKVEHDSSVRDTTDGTIVQFLYGEDGLDVGKARYLSDFKFVGENYVSLFNSFGVKSELGSLISEDAKEHNKAAEKRYRKTGDLGASDPALSLYPPSKYAGSMSEKVYTQSKAYVDGNADGLIKDKKTGKGVLSKKAFNSVVEMRYLKSVAEAGDAVGVVAGQSVGEPSTQMTLNTFHLAGHAAKNVTLGIPRLREIVMTAAANIATPTMTLTLNEGLTQDDGRKFAKGISRLSLADLTDKVTVTESTGRGVSYAEAKRYDISLEFFPAEEYLKEYAITTADVVATIEHRLLPWLQSLTRKELKKRGDAKSLKAGTSSNSDAQPEIGVSAGTIEQESARPGGTGEGGDDDSDDEGDDDATRDKARSNKQQSGYEAYEDEDEVRIAKETQEADDVPEPDSEDETYGGSPPPTPSPKETYKAAASLAKDREARIKGNKTSNDIVQFSFDDKRGARCKFAMEYDSTTAKILMLNIVETALRNALVQSVPNISLCILDVEASEASSDNSVILLANGVNLPAIWDYQHVVHPNRITTNSVTDMLKYYGVEAARNTIVRELQAVFGSHAINVDPRHLTLIGDFMTRGGDYAPFNRMGYRGNPSPFMKMSFETTLGFLKDAVQEADVDHLTGPSARIVAGRLGTMGTGGFDVFLPLKQDLTTNEDDEEADIAMTDGLINEALMGNVGAKGQVVDEESSTDGDDDEDEDEDVVMEE